MRLGAAGCIFPLPSAFTVLSLTPSARCHRHGAGQGWESISGEEVFFPILSFFFLLCVMGRQLLARQGLPGHLTSSEHASQKPLLRSVPCQTWCFSDVFEEGPPQQGPHRDYISSVRVMPTSHLLPGIYQGGQRGVTAFGVAQPVCTHHGSSLFPALAGLCLTLAERNTRVGAHVSFFPSLMSS